MDFVTAMRQMMGIRTADEKARAAGLSVEDISQPQLQAAPVQAVQAPMPQQPMLRTAPVQAPVSGRQALLDRALDDIEAGTGVAKSSPNPDNSMLKLRTGFNQ